MLSPDMVSAKVNQICNRSMSIQESLCLPDRFKPSHHPLPHPGRFVRLFCPIILILLGAVDRLRNQFPMSNPIAAQLLVRPLTPPVSNKTCPAPRCCAAICARLLQSTTAITRARIGVAFSKVCKCRRDRTK